LPGTRLKDIGITFKNGSSYNSNQNAEMSQIAKAIRGHDTNYEIFSKQNPGQTFVTNGLIVKVRNFQIPPTTNAS
jgi:hypothetical protein